MPRGASPKREREYNELKDKFEGEGRYKGREEEVASRIVNKQRSQYGETKKAQRQARKGTEPDRSLPIEDYRHLTIPQVMNRMKRLSPNQVKQVERYEKAHKNRKALLKRIDQHFHA